MSLNTDFDGLATGFILKHAFKKMSIVSFNNSKNHIWTKNRYGKKTLVFVDYNNKTGFSCDQHVDKCLEESVELEDDVLNPNHFLGISNQNYGDKYGFGLYIFILSGLEKMGYDFSDVDLGTEISQGITLGEILMRADYTLGSCIDERYRRKALFWKNMLCEGLPKTSLTVRIFAEIGKMSVTVKDSHDVEKWNISVSKKVKEAFGTDVKTGFKRVCPKFFELAEAIGKAFNIENAIDTDINNYDVTLLSRVRYTNSDVKMIDAFTNDSRVVSKVLLFKNTVSVQVKQSDIRDIVKQNWEHIETDQNMKERFYEDNDRRVYVRKANDDGSGGYEMYDSKMKEYVEWK